MTVTGLSKPKTMKVKAIPVKQSPASAGFSLPQEMTRFRLFWDLMDAVQIHGYIRAAMSVIGRSTVGAWWSLVKHPEFGKEGKDLQRKRLMQFYLMPQKQWKNIKDYQNLTYKIMIGTMYLKYFGQCAYQIVRNSEGQPIGFDFLPGFMMPNVDAEGNFKSPAFIQYPTKNSSVKVEFSDPRDIIFIVNPDWEGKPTGGSDVESLTSFTLPTDMYLQTAAREYLKNRDKPEAFFQLPADVSDEAFEAFSKAIQDRYQGPANVGRSPITVAGELEIKELSKLPEDLPYQEARSDTRQELLAVSGVAGAKLGLTESLSSANLREARREFHETTMIPLFRLIENALYEQIHVREFGFLGWEFKFGNPDFLNAVERATVHMRYHDMGVVTPNEIRHDLNKPARKDEYGDKYVDEIEQENKKQDREAKPQGSPPEGREQNPDSPSQTGEPTLDDQDPPRGDQHDDVTERALMDELRRWKSFASKRFGKAKARKFETTVIPDYLYDAIQDRLDGCKSIQEVNRVFVDTIYLFEEELSCEQ